MKSGILAACVIAFTVLAGTAAHARQVVAVMDHRDVAVVSAAGKKLSAEQVRQAIVKAATSKHWTVSDPADGVLQATLSVRGKHSITVVISWTGEKYSVAYKDSLNMNATGQNPTLIHPNYNKWVQDLVSAIQVELIATA